MRRPRAVDAVLAAAVASRLAGTRGILVLTRYRAYRIPAAPARLFEIGITYESPFDAIWLELYGTCSVVVGASSDDISVGRRVQGDPRRAPYVGFAAAGIPPVDPDDLVVLIPGGRRRVRVMTAWEAMRGVRSEV